MFRLQSLVIVALATVFHHAPLSAAAADSKAFFDQTEAARQLLTEPDPFSSDLSRDGIATIAFNDNGGMSGIRLGYYNMVVTPLNSTVEIFAGDCNTTVPATVANVSQVDSGTHADLAVFIDIMQDAVIGSNIWLFDDDVPNGGIIRICVRVDLLLDDVSKASATFHDGVKLTVQLLQGFEIIGIDLERTGASPSPPMNSTAPTASPFPPMNSTAPTAQPTPAPTGRPLENLEWFWNFSLCAVSVLVCWWAIYMCWNKHQDRVRRRRPVEFELPTFNVTPNEDIALLFALVWSNGHDGLSDMEPATLLDVFFDMEVDLKGGNVNGQLDFSRLENNSLGQLIFLIIGMVIGCREISRETVTVADLNHFLKVCWEIICLSFDEDFANLEWALFIQGYAALALLAIGHGQMFHSATILHAGELIEECHANVVGRRQYQPNVAVVTSLFELYFFFAGDSSQTNIAWLNSVGGKAILERVEAAVQDGVYCPGMRAFEESGQGAQALTIAEAQCSRT